MSKEIEVFASELGYKAKELMLGMPKRVERLPDIADFAAAFKPMIEEFLADQESLARIWTDEG